MVSAILARMPAHKLQGRMKLYGFEISIENAKGSVRRWYDPHGKEAGHTKMHFDYGYIRGTKGTDGDHVDVYVGPNPESDRVFVVNQMKKPPEDTDGAWTRFDEQKVMLAFKDAAAAKAAYLKQYDDSRFFGGMKEMSVDDFKAKVLDRENHGKKVAAMARLMAELNLSKLASGEPIVLPSEVKVARNDILGEGTPGITVLPAITHYSQATMSKQERRKADNEMKVSGLSHTHETTRGLPPAAVAEGKRVEAEHTKSPDTARQIAIDHLHEDPKYYDKLRRVEGKTAGDRVGRIADRVDDVGIGLLAAPYAASAAGHRLARARNPKLQALGTAVEKGLGLESAFGKSHGREIAGLAMVAPGVTHTVAKGIDKVTKKANGDMLQYFADHPDKLKEKQERDRKKKAELEKIAMHFFEDYEYETEGKKASILATLGRMAGGTANTARGLVGGTGTSRMMKAMTSAERAAVAPTLGQQFRAGVQSSVRGREVSPQAVQRLDRLRQAKVPAAALPVTTGGVPTPVAAPSLSKSKWNPLSTRNLLLGGGAAALGVGAYGGYKGIQTAGNLLQTTHEAPLAPPGFAGAGRAF